MKLYVDENSIYEVEYRRNKVILIYSKLDGAWTKPDTKAYTLKDTGNNYKLKDHITGDVLYIDYAQFNAISIFLKLEKSNETSNNDS